MSLILDPCAARIAAGKASGKHMVELFEVLASQAEEVGSTTSEVVVHYLEPDDDFKIGKFVPELRLIVRRIEPDSVEARTNGE